MKTYKVETNNLTLAQAKAVKKVVDQYLSKAPRAKAVWGGAEPPMGKVTRAASDSDSIIWGS